MSFVRLGALTTMVTLAIASIGCPGEIHFAADDAGDTGALPSGTRCTVDANCGGTTPRCDTATNTCVQCIAAADCATDDTTCDTNLHKCRPKCSSTLTCPSVVPVCDEARGVCLGCVRDNQCVGEGARARCEVSTGRCVECLSASDCKAPGRPTCDAISGDCAH